MGRRRLAGRDISIENGGRQRSNNSAFPQRRGVGIGGNGVNRGRWSCARCRASRGSYVTGRRVEFCSKQLAERQEMGSEGGHRRLKYLPEAASAGSRAGGGVGACPWAIVIKRQGYG